MTGTSSRRPLTTSNTASPTSPPTRTSTPASSSSTPLASTSTSPRTTALTAVRLPLEWDQCRPSSCRDSRTRTTRPPLTTTEPSTSATTGLDRDSSGTGLTARLATTSNSRTVPLAFTGSLLPLSLGLRTLPSSRLLPLPLAPPLASPPRVPSPTPSPSAPPSSRAPAWSSKLGVLTPLSFTPFSRSREDDNEGLPLCLSINFV
mmetsp:Transcript_19713/g.32314  ORF Transcript_19713/g.32314 Transcript_19713/m.32314 type:complete len:204 (-) Transcript_19713:13-624(-)